MKKKEKKIVAMINFMSTWLYCVWVVAKVTSVLSDSLPPYEL